VPHLRSRFDLRLLHGLLAALNARSVLVRENLRAGAGREVPRASRLCCFWRRWVGVGVGLLGLPCDLPWVRCLVVVPRGVGGRGVWGVISLTE
jgi:hypothetical protein